jgi:LacI family transcriptional regulator
MPNQVQQAGARHFAANTNVPVTKSERMGVAGGGLTMASPVTSPRVLIVLAASAGWSRGILTGFNAVAREQGWDLLYYNPGMSLDWLGRRWKPTATVLGPEVGSDWPRALCSSIVVSVNADRIAEGVPSVCLDERQIARVGLEHLLSKGLRSVTTFRFDESPFAVAREQAFRDAARASGARIAGGWSMGGAEPSRAHEDPTTIGSWVEALPRPCGVFACCDAWGQVVARYARAADLRVPEDVSIVGVDNDTIQCELTDPPLSSVTVPWQAVGRQAAQLVRLALSGQSITGTRIVVGPGHVMPRRSSDVLAIEDALVARAVRWIYEHSARALTVPSVGRAVAASRRRLERRFHAVLGRTVVQEIRRVRVETAKRLLTMTRHRLAHIAQLSGFTSAALLNVAFRREVGLPPGAYRRQFQDAAHNEG